MTLETARALMNDDSTLSILCMYICTRPWLTLFCVCTCSPGVNNANIILCMYMYNNAKCLCTCTPGGVNNAKLFCVCMYIHVCTYAIIFLCMYICSWVNNYVNIILRY